MIKLANFFILVNNAIFTFFSGIFVSFACNVFTSVILDSTIYFTIISTSALVLIALGSAALVLLSVLQESFIVEADQKKKIGITLEDQLLKPKTRKSVVMLTAILVFSIIAIIGGSCLLGLSTIIK